MNFLLIVHIFLLFVHCISAKLIHPADNNAFEINGRTPDLPSSKNFIDYFKNLAESVKDNYEQLTHKGKEKFKELTSSNSTTSTAKIGAETETETEIQPSSTALPSTLGLPNSKTKSAIESPTKSQQLPKKEQFLVKKLPNISDSRLDSIVSYAGNMNLTNSVDQLFFWLVTNSTNVKNRDSLVLWLNGGPGCTSMDGLFLENGPYKFRGDKTVVMREHAFSTLVDVLYVDQPFGTGFSPARSNHYATNYVKANSYFLQFLASFFETFPEYKSRKLIISGESQAGVYLGYLAKSLLYDNSTMGINLHSVMIGNGWIDPLRMYASYQPFAEMHNLTSAKTNAEMIQDTNDCLEELKGAPFVPINFGSCNKIMGTFLGDDKHGSRSCVNMYDMRLIEQKPSCGMDWPPGLSDMTKYLAKPQVQKAINADINPDWTECSSSVSMNIYGGDNIPSVAFLPDILKKVDVNLFAGREDIICNSLGIEYLIGNLTWGGQKGFTLLRPGLSKKRGLVFNKRAPADTGAKGGVDYPSWTIDGKQVGSIHTERRLTYTLIFNASHMTGFDQPLAMLDLLSRTGSLDKSHIPQLARSAVSSKIGKFFGHEESQTVKETNRGYVAGAFLLFIFMMVGLLLILSKQLGLFNTNRYCCFIFPLNMKLSGLGGGGSGSRQDYEPDYVQLSEFHRDNVISPTPPDGSISPNHRIMPMSSSFPNPSPYNTGNMLEETSGLQSLDSLNSDSSDSVNADDMISNHGAYEIYNQDSIDSDGGRTGVSYSRKKNDTAASLPVAESGGAYDFRMRNVELSLRDLKSGNGGSN